MAGGKSKSGRGGGKVTGKRNNSGQRVSSASSNQTNAPATASPASVSIPPRMPSQYSPASEEVAASSSKHNRVQRSQPQTTPTSVRRMNSLTPPPQNMLNTPSPHPPEQLNEILEHEDDSESEEDEEAEEVEHQEDDNDEDDEEGDRQEGPGLQMTLDALLTTPGRDQFLDVLSPTEGEGLWFDRDETLMVTRVVTIMQDNFQGPWYSWKVTPVEIRDQWFIQFAQEHTWKPLITHLVRNHFIVIAKRRLKGMISTRRRSRRKPAWIRKKLWEKMVAYWDTEAAKQRSRRASKARKSERGGLGAHKHVGGPKSNAQIQREMTIQEGREVSFAEVFIKTHTRKDGTFVDEKAKKIAEVYDNKVQSTQTQLDGELSMTTSDGASRAPELTTQQKNDIFLQSTMMDERGNPYGLGRMARILDKGKKQVVLSSSSAIVGLQSKLMEAEEQMAQMAEQNKQQQELTQMFLKYLKEKDPELPSWLQTQMTPAPPQPTQEDNEQGTPTNT